MQRPIRTFVALEISDEIRAQARQLISRLRETAADVKWVESQNLHLTLKFLDKVPANEIPRICQIVARATAQLPPFEIEIRGAGAFPNAHQPRTLWLGTTTGRESMIELHDVIEAALAPLGFREEHRQFHPHLTLGRVRSGPGVAELADQLAQFETFLAGPLFVDEVAVFASRLDRRGPEYEVLGRAALQKSPSR